MSSLTALNIEPLSVAQRLDLIERLWESIPIKELPIPDWHRRELERRLEAANANPHDAIPWEQVRDELRRRSCVRPSHLVSEDCQPCDHS